MKTFDHIQSGGNFNAGRKSLMALSHIFQSYIYQGNILAYFKTTLSHTY